MKFSVFLLGLGLSTLSAKDVVQNQEERISGGTTAGVGEFPYIVSLQVNNQGLWVHQCSGAIVSQSWVVTLATCANNAVSNMRVVAGEFDLDHPGNTEQSSMVEKVVYYQEDFELDEPHNIAMMKLMNRLAYSTG